MRSARDSSSAAASPPVNGTTATAAAADPPIMKKRRRSTPAAFLLSLAGALPSDGLLIAISSKSNVRAPSVSLGQRKSFGFQFHEHTADAADGAIEVGRLRHLKIGEHPRSPRLQMPLEEPLLFVEAGLEVVARETGHDLEQDRDVIFRLPR